MDQIILTRDEGEALMISEGKRVVPLDNASGTYREWLVVCNTVSYCIVDKDDTWTLMRDAPGTTQWVDATETVDAFLVRHRLILAA